MVCPVQFLPVTMTSLPTGCPAQPAALPPADLPKAAIGNAGAENEQFLLRAFRTFAEAASSLERSYGNLRLEVTGLRRELEELGRSFTAQLPPSGAPSLQPSFAHRILDGMRRLAGGS